MDQMLEPDGAGSASCERNPDLGPDLSGDDLLEFLNSVEMSEEEREELSTLPQDPMKPNGERPVLPAFAVAAATAANWVMYVGTTPTGQRYIGITSNFLQRQAAHLQNGMKTSQIQLGRSFYYAQAKGAEQVLIEAGRSIGLNLKNAINSISPANPYYQQFKSMGAEILNDCRTDIAALFQ